jgi:MFS family permease
VRRTFASLRIRNYRLFAGGQLISLTGSWMQRVGQDWLVLRLSHNSGTAIGITTGLQFLPILLFGLQGGLIADRFSKRKLILATQASMALLALGLGLLDLSGAATLYEVYLFAFLLGLATAVDNPTRQSFVAELVGSEELPNAVGLNSATFNAARIFGPAAAGLLIDGVGTAWAFLGNAASFLAVIAGLLMMRPSELFPAPRLARHRGGVREGLSYVKARRELLVPIVLVGVVGTFGLNFQITLALVDKVVFHRGAASFGLLSSLLAAGALVGALLSARRRHPTLRLVMLGAIVFGALEMCVAFMPSFVLFALVLVPVGLANITFSTAANSSVQLASAPEMRGRVMGIYMLVFAGGTPLGAPLVGWVSQVLGARFGLILGGALSLGAGAVVLALSLKRAAAPSPGQPLPAAAPVAVSARLGSWFSFSGDGASRGRPSPP